MVLNHGKLVEGDSQTKPGDGCVCLSCIHLIEPIPPKCRAFSRIPISIWAGAAGHSKPISGDRGIQFEPRGNSE